MPLRVECRYCGKEVDPSHRAGNYRRVTGWEQTRMQGGANKITLREDTGEWAHRNCVETLVLGIDVNQGTLI